jgi:alkylation response protein AidB-like acyl-CoA dehydrogenase
MPAARAIRTVRCRRRRSLGRYAVTTTLGRPSTADVLDAVRRLEPEIRDRAPEIEAARRVPGDLLDRLDAAGCRRLLLPGSHGGLGGDLVGAMAVFEELARADASVAWVTLLGAGSWVDIAGLPRATFDELFPPEAPARVAGVFSPTGTAVPVDAGYLVNGRWGFATGCEDADWIYGNCVDASSGTPQLRIAVFRADEVVLEDTWSVSGMRGTGSHHFSAHDVVVPAARTVSPFTDPHSVDTTLLHIPVPGSFALVMPTVPLGVARAALDDVLELAAGKVPLLAGDRLATSPWFQQTVGDADVQLRAARALLYAEADAAWSAAAAGEEFTLADRARMRSAAVHAARTAATVTEAAYRAGGGSSLYESSPLQRRLRDVNALVQHFLLKPDTLTTCGALLAGEEPELTVF